MSYNNIKILPPPKPTLNTFLSDIGLNTQNRVKYKTINCYQVKKFHPTKTLISPIITHFCSHNVMFYIFIASSRQKSCPVQVICGI